MNAPRIILSALAAICLLSPLAAISAPVATPAPAPAVASGIPADPVTSAATHIIIYDVGAGQTLYCRRCNLPMAPSSMSKLMTMLVVEDQLKAGKITLDTTYRVSENAWRHGAQSDGSHMFLELNSRVRVEDLIRGVVVVSANDACIVLAEGIAGSELAFVDLMNQRAKALGLTSAHFANATGLPDPEHVISATDLARLSAVIINENPELYRHYAETSLTYNNHTQGNRNPLLGTAGADGVKTGHTEIAGYGMIGSAVINGQRRIIVINGLHTERARAEEAKRLMNAAFYDFTVISLYAKDATVGQADVWLGSRPQAPLVATQAIAIGMHRSIRAGMKATIVYNGPLTAPIKQGAIVAHLVVDGPGVHQEFPLAAGARIGRANPFARAGFGLQHLFGSDS